jgi:hypothetical protein
VRSIGSFRICGPAKKGVSRSALPHACVHLQYRGRRTSPIDVLGRSAFSRAAQGSVRRHPRSFCTLLARNASVDQNIHASITYIYSAAGRHTIIDQSDRDDEQAVQGSIGVLLLLVDAASNTSRSMHLTWMRAVTPRGHVRAKAAPACRSSRAAQMQGPCRAFRWDYRRRSSRFGARITRCCPAADSADAGAGRGPTGLLLCGGLCRPQPSAPGFLLLLFSSKSRRQHVQIKGQQC